MGEIIETTLSSESRNQDSEVLRPEIVGEQEETPGYALLDPGAVTALAFAITSFVFLPVIGALVALVLAHKSKSRIHANADVLRGRGLARAAQILAFLNLAAVAFIVWLVVNVLHWAVSGIF